MARLAYFASRVVLPTEAPRCLRARPCRQFAWAWPNAMDFSVTGRS
ncbi:MAG: hypothetical protein ACLQK8_22790 [Streptosporangiaceae bacterium]